MMKLLDEMFDEDGNLTDKGVYYESLMIPIGLALLTAAQWYLGMAVNVKFRILLIVFTLHYVRDHRELFEKLWATIGLYGEGSFITTKDYWKEQVTEREPLFEEDGSKATKRGVFWFAYLSPVIPMWAVCIWLGGVFIRIGAFISILLFVALRMSIDEVAEQYAKYGVYEVDDDEESTS